MNINDMKPTGNYNEILVLDEMLRKAEIPHTIMPYFGGWVIKYPNSEEVVCSAIEHNGSYGRNDDKIEIMGLMTKKEKKRDCVVGHLTAEEVFNRIKKHYEDERGD